MERERKSLEEEGEELMLTKKNLGAHPLSSPPPRPEKIVAPEILPKSRTGQLDDLKANDRGSVDEEVACTSARLRKEKKQLAAPADPENVLFRSNT